MKNYLKMLEELLIEEGCHTLIDSQMIGKLLELADRDEAKQSIRSSVADKSGHYFVRDTCPRCRIAFPFQVIITYCPNCGQHIRKV